MSVPRGMITTLRNNSRKDRKMHTLHYIAVTAEDKQDAYSKVVTYLEPSDEGYRQADWSDWHVVGGGRWNSKGSQYDNSDSDVISYSEDKDKFDEAIAGVRKSRINEMNRLMEHVNTDKFISDMVDYISNGGEIEQKQRYDLNSYYVKSAAKLLQGYWTPDSYFYDMDEHVGSFDYLKERLDNPDTAAKQYLVPVDFHF